MGMGRRDARGAEGEITMKPKPTPQPAALPRAVVCDIYLCEDRKTIRAITPGHSTAGAPEAERSIIGNVRPHRTHAAATRAAKWANLSEGEKVDKVARELHLQYRIDYAVPGSERWEMQSDSSRESYLRRARAVLKLTGDLA